ncbi:MAG: sigma-70 family RNA polymerase sigma factor [Streptomycetaceae bacterium]|nr:sigma-70 family RNA polymerase sigma factor [Streptomycetaceae bacterium]
MRKASVPSTAGDTAVQLSGTDLVNAARSGDTRAQAILFSEYLPLVYNIVGRGLHGHADVDDVVQETMLRAMRALPRLREPERFRSWIVAIAIRQMHDHGRRNKATMARHLPLTDIADVPDTSRDFAERAVDQQTLIRAGSDLREASRWLNDDQRQTMALWWQEAAGQLSRTEVAEALNLSVPHTAVRIQRMKAKLELAVGVLAAWRARPRCPDLDALTDGGQVVAGGRVLTKLSRHVKDCPRCQAVVSAWGSIDGVPIRLSGLAVPAALAAGIRGLVGQHGQYSMAPGLLSSWWHGFRHSLGRISAKSAVAVGATTALATLAAPAIYQYAPHPHAIPAAQSPTPAASAAHRPGPTPSASRTTPFTTPTTTTRAYSGVATADYYVAPDGDDTNPGTLARPFATLTRAVSKARPGQTVGVRGGTYRPGSTIALKTSGTVGRPITVSNYRDERPVFDGAGLPARAWFVVQSGAYTTVQGIEIVNAPNVAYACESCHNDDFRLLSVHDTAYHNGAAGFAFVRSAATLQGNLALANQPDSWLGSRARHTGNSWDQSGWTISVLRLTGAALTTAPRRSDGSLPSTLFLSNTKDASIGAALMP